MRPRQDPKLFGVLNPYEPHEVLHVTPIRPPRLLVADIPKPLNGWGHRGEPVELRGRERPRSLTTRAVLLSSCPSFFARLLPMIIYFIRGKSNHQIHTLSQDQVSVSGGDDLTHAVLFVVLPRLHFCARIRVEKTYSLSSS
jgi:hypothetical protein